jgi:hypothetical protein
MADGNWRIASYSSGVDGAMSLAREKGPDSMSMMVQGGEIRSIFQSGIALSLSGGHTRLLLRQFVVRCCYLHWLHSTGCFATVPAVVWVLQVAGCITPESKRCGAGQSQTVEYNIIIQCLTIYLSQTILYLSQILHLYSQDTVHAQRTPC